MTLKVNLKASTSTSTEQELRLIYKLGNIWEKEHKIKPNTGGLLYLLSDAEGNLELCDWLSSKGIKSQFKKIGDVASIIDIDETPELTKLLLES
jgi:hypothetical protein